MYNVYYCCFFNIYIIKVADHPNKPLSSEKKNQHSKNAIVIILFEFLVFQFSYKNSSNLIFIINFICKFSIYTKTVYFFHQEDLN